MIHSHHCADAAVFGLGAAAGNLRRWRWRRAVEVATVGRVAAVAVLWVWRVLAVRRRRVALVWRALQMGRWVVVMVVVVRRGILGHVAERDGVRMDGNGRVRLRSGRVVQVSRVRGVGDKSGVGALRDGAGAGPGRPHPPGAKQRPEQGGGAGQGVSAVTGRTVSTRRGSPPHVRTANDGALQRRKQNVMET